MMIYVYFNQSHQLKDPWRLNVKTSLASFSGDYINLQLISYKVLKKWRTCIDYQKIQIGLS